MMKIPKMLKRSYYNKIKKTAQKRMHSAFLRGTDEVRDDSNSWLWMKKGYLKKETEGLIIAAQDQSL